jgi:uncharacterized membrane protein HdeD (DUF308 family)
VSVPRLISGQFFVGLGILDLVALAKGIRPFKGRWWPPTSAVSGALGIAYGLVMLALSVHS